MEARADIAARFMQKWPILESRCDVPGKFTPEDVADDRIYRHAAGFQVMSPLPPRLQNRLIMLARGREISASRAGCTGKTTEALLNSDNIKTGCAIAVHRRSIDS